MKRLLMVFLCITAVVFSMIGIAGDVTRSATSISIEVDGAAVVFDEPLVPFEQNGEIWTPLRKTAKQAGFSVKLPKSGKQVLIQLENPLYGLTIAGQTGSATWTVNGETRQLTAPPIIRQGNVFVVAKDFYHAQNCATDWDVDLRTLNVSTPTAQVFVDKHVVSNPATEALTIDGQDLEADWTEAKVLGDFTTTFYNEPAASPSDFRVVHDSEALYLFVRCTGKPVPLEGINVVLAPEKAIVADQTPYYHLTVSPEPQNTAHLRNGLYVSFRTNEQVLLSKSSYQSACTVSETGWTAEIRIPYQVLRTDAEQPVPTPEAGAEWRLNVSRVRPFCEALSSWMPLRAANYREEGARFYVEEASAASSARTGSVFFNCYPAWQLPDDSLLQARVKIPASAKLIYQGYDRKTLVFERKGLHLDPASLAIEWIDVNGLAKPAELISTATDKNMGAITFEHLRMPRDGLYRLVLYVREHPAVRYEFIFDKQHVMDAGVHFNDRFLPPPAPPSVILDAAPISDAAQKMISIVPDVVGLCYTGNPALPSAGYSSVYRYDYVNAPNKVTAAKAAGGIKTTITKGVGVVPEAYNANGILTLLSRDGNPVHYPYYDNGKGERYFLDSHVDYLAKDYLKLNIRALADQDPLGTAWLLYEIATKYQNWLPTCDIGKNGYPIQWNWGPPFAYMGGIFNRWYTSDLTSMKFYVQAYQTVKATNAFQIVSEAVGFDVERLIVNKMFLTNLDFTKTYPVLGGNMDYNAWLGRIALSDATRNPDYMHDVYTLMDDFVSSQYMLDGFFREVTYNYHSATMVGNNLSTALMKGWTDPPGYISPRTGMHFDNLDMDNLYPALVASNEILDRLAYPNGKQYPIQDTWAHYDAKPYQGLRPDSMLLSAANIARMSKGSGIDTQQLYLTFVPKYGHDHADALNLSLYANQRELLPDLGYTTSGVRSWVSSTIAHNTVLVNSRDAAMYGAGRPGGKLDTYAEFDQTVQVMKASQENAYSGVSEYSREPWFIQLEGSDQSYVLDLFRVKGGSRHEYTLGGDAISEDSAFVTPLPFTEQFAQMPGSYTGYSLVKNVGKASLDEAGRYEVTMVSSDGATPRPGLKITGITGAASDLYIGQSPSIQSQRIGQGYDASDTTGRLIVRREGSNLQSTFVHVMEPLAVEADAVITSIDRLDAGASDNVAMRIQYGSTVDWILSNNTPSVPLTAGDITLNGKMAFVRTVNGQVTRVNLVGATSLIFDGQTYTGLGSVQGNIQATRRILNGDSLNAFVVPGVIPAEAADNTLIVRHPDGTVNGYLITAIHTEGTNSLIEVRDADPGFDVLSDGSSILRFWPQTEWTDTHTYRIDLMSRAP